MPTATYTPKPATTNQAALIERLQAERGMSAVGIDEGTSFKAASAMIEALLSLPKRGGAPQPARAQSGEDIGDMTPRIEGRESAMMAAGRLLCTLTGPDGRHVTIMFKARVKRSRWERCTFAKASHIFITAGKDGDKVATYYPQSGKFSVTPERFGGDKLRAQAALAVLKYLAGVRSLRQGSSILAANECGYCGRPLTDPESIERGIGPDCYGQHTGSAHVTKGAKSGAGVSADPQFDFARDSAQVREGYFKTLRDSLHAVGRDRVSDAVREDERLTDNDKGLILAEVGEVMGDHDPNTPEAIVADCGVDMERAAEMSAARQKHGF